MKAIRIYEAGPSNVMKYETDVAIPLFGSKQVLVRVKAIGVNLFESMIRNGFFGARPAYTPGTDAAGVVEHVGNEVTNVKVGDRVFVAFGDTEGAYAEFMAVDSYRVFELPDNVTFEQGAALGIPYFTAYRAIVSKGHLKAGQTVLVHGASGGVGIACMQIAKDIGATVIGTASTPEGQKEVEKYGVAFNHRQEGYDKEIAKQFKVDLICEMVTEKNIAKDLDMIAFGGTVVVIGCLGVAEGVNYRTMMKKESTIVGMNLIHMKEPDAAESGKYLINGLRKGVLSPVISISLPLAEAAKALELVAAESKAPGKIVLTV